MRRSSWTPSTAVVLALAASLLVAPPAARAQAGGERARLVASLDSAVRAHASDSLVAGVAVAVVQGTDTLLHGGYGHADLEFDVPTPRDAVYEIGSITKQFTAASILRLVEEGRLDLDADVTEYLPGLRTRGHRIPVRRLLDHTSGLRGYTEMPAFGTISMQELPRDTLVSLVTAEPLDFVPGAAMIYNNSAYFLLGLVLEELTGQAYAEYVQEHLFGPLGMEDSYYCDERAVVRHRAHGYDAGPEGRLVRKAYLDHTWPYSAGSLCSTAGDLVAWNRALHGGRVLGEDAYREMVTPGRLTDGTRLRYAMGLAVHEAGGHRVIEHGGGINGFLSQSSYYPDDDLVVVVLQNTAGPRAPAPLAEALASRVLGPGSEPGTVPYRGELAPFTGRYGGRARGRTLLVRIELEDGGLVAYRGEGAEEGEPLTHLAGLTWSRGPARYTFVRSGERVVELRMDRIGGHYPLRRVGVSP